MKKILITGGAGFLGYHLANYLFKKGIGVRIYDLNGVNKNEYPLNGEFIVGDIRDKSFFSESFKNIDAVVHAAAALPLWEKEDIFTTNVDGTRNVLDLGLKAGVDRVVFVSSTAVYGIPEKHPIFENDKVVGVGHYGESKIQAEKICDEFRKKGLCVPIVRPKTFIGTNRLGVFSILYDWVFSGKKIPMIGNGENRYQLLEVEDLCSAIYLALTKDRVLANDTFNVGAKEFKTVREDLKCMCEFAKTGARPMGFPALPVKFLLRIFEILNLSPLYRWIYGTADKDSFVSTDKIEKVLGWKPEFSNCETLIRSYEWYLKNKDKVDAAGEGITHTVAWKQGILKIFKKFL